MKEKIYEKYKGYMIYKNYDVVNKPYRYIVCRPNFYCIARVQSINTARFIILADIATKKQHKTK